MDYAVVQLGQLRAVPTVGSTYQIAGDALQAVDAFASALRTFIQTSLGVFVATIHTAVAVVINGTIADVILVHHIYHTHDDFRIVRSVTINFYIEDMTTTSQVVIWSFDFSFVAGATLVIYRYVIGVSVILTVGNAWQAAEFLLVIAGKFA